MNFFIKFFITLFTLFIIYIAAVFVQTSRPTAMSQWVYDVYEKKTSIAHTIQEPKIIIVSGSNALFGIDSKMLSEHFDKKVINYGVNAGVLLPYTLYKAKEIIKPHDTVLLPLEYHMYTYDGIPNEQMIDYIFSRDIKAFYSLTTKEQFYMVWNITFKRLYDGYKAQGGEKVTQGLYGSHNIDEYGDQKSATKEAKSEAIAAELDAHKPNNYGSLYSKDLLMWNYLEKFVSWCKSQNTKVIFVPSTMLYFDTYKTDSKERWFYENIANEIRNRGWEFVGNPYDYMYAKDSYFNTDFHLTSEAKEIRTKQLINNLKLSLTNI